MSAKKRIHTLDEIRGFCVFCMVFDHALFTLGYMYYHEFSRQVFDILSYISPFFAATFMLICGVSCMLSKDNKRRGIKILTAAFAVTLVSVFLMPQAPIHFGILHLLGSCVILYALLGKFIDRVPAPLGIILCCVLFLLFFNTEKGYLLFEPFSLYLPSALYESGLLMIFGFKSPYAAYSDYFPLLPWMFSFFCGIFIGRYLADGKAPKCMYKSRVPFFSLLGTNAFLIYLIHQPLIFGVYYLISLTGGI